MTSRREVFAPLQGVEYAAAMSAIVSGGFEPAEFVLEERCSVVRQPGGGQRVWWTFKPRHARPPSDRA